MNYSTLLEALGPNFNQQTTFQTTSSAQPSKTINFFDQLYTYPQKLSLKWELLSSKTNKFCEEVDNSAFTWNPNYSIAEEAATTDYTYFSSEYLKGYLDKINSSKFYRKETKPIQSTLANVPVFVILNGDNEIVLSKTKNPNKPASIKSYVKEVLYESCGAFDLTTEIYPDQGFFFMDYADAENYLKSIAKSDIDGVKTVGLSIHCIGLDSAYRITREYHPGMDFRFIAKLTGVNKSLNGVPVHVVEFYDTSKNDAPNTTKKLLFFNVKQAQNFYKENYSKPWFKKAVNQPIRTVALENLLERWEEAAVQGEIQNNEFPLNHYFMSDLNISNHRVPENTGTKIIKSFQQKTRILKRFIGIFFSVA